MTDHPTDAPVLADVSPTVEDLLANEAIRQCLWRYCHGVDRGDREMLLSAYHPDAFDDHGGYSGSAQGFADYIIDKFDRSGRIGQHHVTNMLIERRGSSARVVSYFIAFNPARPDTIGDHDLVGGRYLDDFECRKGLWRIARREVVLDVTRDSLAGDAWPAGLFAVGARRGDDPSSAFLGAR